MITTIFILIRDIKKSPVFLWRFNSKKIIEEVNHKVMEVVKEHFRPEFLNRLDEIIIFNKLSRINMESIVKVQFARLAKRLELKNITLILDDSASHYLANKGYDSHYGARPLKRLIQKEIENILAQKILLSEIIEGKKIIVKFKNDKLDFEELS